MRTRRTLGWICIAASALEAILKIDFMRAPWLVWAIGLFFVGFCLLYRDRQARRSGEGADDLDEIDIADIDGADSD
jgi:hypothetical protein